MIINISILKMISKKKLIIIIKFNKFNFIYKKLLRNFNCYVIKY